MKDKSIIRNWIISLILVLIFSFFTGYYVRYVFNENKSEDKIDIIKRIMEEEWYYGLEDEDISTTLEKKIILSMMDMQKDPYTRYLLSLDALADSFTGIGVSTTRYGEYFIISEVMGQQAVEDGLKVGDIILSINSNSVKGLTSDELTELIPGEGNVKLLVKRNNVNVEINTSVTTYEPITVYTKEYPNASYVKITEFDLNTAKELEEYFSKLNRDNNLILDLRDNPGGYISSVNAVLDLFVASDKVTMSTIDKNGRVELIKTRDDNLYIFKKIIVLINSGSASGAEALSAALNYHLDDIVTLYGETTYKKGSAQKTISFSDGTYFHYTYALWNTPEGVTVNGVGVKPEVYNENMGISNVKVYEKELMLYDYGVEVLGIQEFFSRLGLYSGEKHSFFDKNLENVIKSFQASAPSEENLEVNGKIDNKTLGYISKLIYDHKIIFLDNELNLVLGSMFA